MATKLIPGQWYDDSDGTRVIAIGQNEVTYRDNAGEFDLDEYTDQGLQALTHLPDCDGWDWQPLRVAIGKKYRCRNGSTVKIKGDSPHEEYPFAGSNGYAYTAAGRQHRGGESRVDLIEEIPEPEKPPLQVAVGKTYRCRDGSTVKIEGASSYPDFPLKGSSGYTYTVSGSQSPCGESDVDLIEEIPEPEPDYIDIHKASGLKVGDTVMIEKKTEPKGCCNPWVSGMDAEIGKTGQITRDKGVYGFRVETSTNYLTCPATSLVKVEPKWRPFANLDEAEPFFDQRLREKHTGIVGRITAIGNEKVSVVATHFTFDEAFDEFELLDGTPFGIKVLE